MISFPPCFLIELEYFSSIEPPVFFPYFFIKFRRFFHQLNIHGFFSSFSLSLGSFLYQAMTLNTYMLVEACVQKGRQL